MTNPSAIRQSAHLAPEQGSQASFIRESLAGADAISRRRWNSLRKEVAKIVEPERFEYLSEDQFKQIVGDRDLEFPGEGQLIADELITKIEEYDHNNLKENLRSQATLPVLQDIAGTLAGSLHDWTAVLATVGTIGVGNVLSPLAKLGSKGRWARFGQWAGTPSFARGALIGGAETLAVLPVDALLEESAGFDQFTEADAWMSLGLGTLLGGAGDALAGAWSGVRHAADNADADAVDLEVNALYDGKQVTPAEADEVLDAVDPLHGNNTPLDPRKSPDQSVEGKVIEWDSAHPDAAPPKAATNKQRVKSAGKPLDIAGTRFAYNDAASDTMANLLWDSFDDIEARETLVDLLVEKGVVTGARDKIKEVIADARDRYAKSIAEEVGDTHAGVLARFPPVEASPEFLDVSPVAYGKAADGSKRKFNIEYENDTLKLIDLAGRKRHPMSSKARAELSDSLGITDVELSEMVDNFRDHKARLMRDAEDRTIKLTKDDLWRAAKTSSRKNAQLVVDPYTHLERAFQDAEAKINTFDNPSELKINDPTNMRDPEINEVPGAVTSDRIEIEEELKAKQSDFEEQLTNGYDIIDNITNSMKKCAVGD